MSKKQLLNEEQKSRFSELAGLNEDKKQRRRKLTEQVDKIRTVLGESRFINLMIESMDEDELEEKIEMVRRKFEDR